MIITKYPISIEIDGVEHKLVLAEPSLVQQRALQEAYDAHNSTSVKLSALHVELEAKTNEYSINKQLLGSMAILEASDAEKSENEEQKSALNKVKTLLKKAGDKISLLMEQKQLNREIAALRAAISELNESRDTNNSALELTYKERFEVLVSGEGKLAVKNIIDNSEVSYTELFEEINRLAIEYKKKK
jgi:hypothetical protein